MAEFAMLLNMPLHALVTNQSEVLIKHGQKLKRLIIFTLYNASCCYRYTQLTDEEKVLFNLQSLVSGYCCLCPGVIQYVTSGREQRKEFTLITEKRQRRGSSGVTVSSASKCPVTEIPPTQAHFGDLPDPTRV